MGEAFDIHEWRSRLFELGDGGVCRVLQHCSTYCGTIDEGSYLPIIFKTFRELRRELGISSDGFFGPVKRAEKLGLCRRVDAHGLPGRRQLLVLCFPEDTALRAVARAAGSAERWTERTEAYCVDWITKSISLEMRRIRRRVSQKESVEKSSKCGATHLASDPSESLNFRDPTSENQRTNHRKSEVRTSYIKREQKIAEKSESVEPDDSPHAEPANQVDLSPFGTWLRKVLEQFDDVVSEFALRQVDTAFADADLDGAHLRRLVTAKLVRLHGDGYGVHQVLSFLLEDVDDLRERCSPSIAQRAHPARDESKRMRSESRETDADRKSYAGQMNPLADETPVDFWPEVLELLRDKFREDTYDRFIAELVGVRWDESIIVTADEDFTVAWVHDRWRDLVEESISEASGHDVDVQWESGESSSAEES